MFRRLYLALVIRPRPPLTQAQLRRRDELIAEYETSLARVRRELAGRPE